MGEQKKVVEFALLDTGPEIQLLQLLMDASRQFDDQLTFEEKERAVAYFQNWHSQTRKSS